MYDRNKGVQSIIFAGFALDEDEIYPKGGIFNINTGKISHTEKLPDGNAGWRYITFDFYPVYDYKNQYIGVGHKVNYKGV